MSAYFPTPLARTTDPVQSHAAAKRVNAGNQRGRTLAYIIEHPHATGPEACPLNAQARITELADMGFIGESGERNGARTWVATARGVSLADNLRKEPNG